MSQGASLTIGARTAALHNGGARLVIADGTMEAVKWLAVLLMTGDHINAYIFEWSIRWLYDAGRLVMPLFGVMLAYNLTREGVNSTTRVRMMKRMAGYAAMALPAYIYLHGYWPFNILATLCLFVFIVHCIEKQTKWYNACAVLAFVFGGALVEFWWFALSVCLAAWMYFKAPTNFRAFALIASISLLAVVNGNHYALVSIVILLWATYVRIEIPRSKQFFYTYYPLHLSILALISLWQART